MDGNSTNVVSMVDFCMRGLNQRIFGMWAAAPLLTNQASSSPEKLSECLPGICLKEGDVQGETTQ